MAARRLRPARPGEQYEQVPIFEGRGHPQSHVRAARSNARSGPQNPAAQRLMVDDSVEVQTEPGSAPLLTSKDVFNHEALVGDASRSSGSAAGGDDTYTLRVKVIKGENLFPMDRDGTSDPFVKCKIVAENGTDVIAGPKQTSWKPRENNPWWEEDLMLDISCDDHLRSVLGFATRDLAHTQQRVPELFRKNRELFRKRQRAYGDDFFGGSVDTTDKFAMESMLRHLLQLERETFFSKCQIKIKCYDHNYGMRDDLIGEVRRSEDWGLLNMSEIKNSQGEQWCQLRVSEKRAAEGQVQEQNRGKLVLQFIVDDPDNVDDPGFTTSESESESDSEAATHDPCFHNKGGQAGLDRRQESNPTAPSTHTDFGLPHKCNPVQFTLRKPSKKPQFRFFWMERGRLYWHRRPLPGHAKKGPCKPIEVIDDAATGPVSRWRIKYEGRPPGEVVISVPDISMSDSAAQVEWIEELREHLRGFRSELGLEVLVLGVRNLPKIPRKCTVKLFCDGDQSISFEEPRGTTWFTRPYGGSFAGSFATNKNSSVETVHAEMNLHVKIPKDRLSRKQPPDVINWQDRNLEFKVSGGPYVCPKLRLELKETNWRPGDDDVHMFAFTEIPLLHHQNSSETPKPPLEVNRDGLQLEPEFWVYDRALASLRPQGVNFATTLKGAIERWWRVHRHNPKLEEDSRAHLNEQSAAANEVSEFVKLLFKLQISDDCVDRVFGQMDIDGSQQVDKDEARKWWNLVSDGDIPGFNSAWKAIGAEHDGDLAKDELRKLLEKFISQQQENLVQNRFISSDPYGDLFGNRHMKQSDFLSQWTQQLAKFEPVLCKRDEVESRLKSLITAPTTIFHHFGDGASPYDWSEKYEGTSTAETPLPTDPSCIEPWRYHRPELQHEWEKCPGTAVADFPLWLLFSPDEEKKDRGGVRCAFRLIDRSAQLSAAETTLWKSMKELMTPRPVLIRVYVIQARNLRPMDSNNFADPYIIAQLGQTKLGDRKKHMKKTLNPDFRQVFEFKDEILPGPAQLKLQVFDYNHFGRDDLCGSTTIDLEHRWLCRQWREGCPKKPIETRTLRHEIEGRRWRKKKKRNDKHGLGELQLWVDIIDLRDGQSEIVKPINIAKPEPIQMQLRVIVWNSEHMKRGKHFGGMNDLYFSGHLRTKLGTKVIEHPVQKTDTHWRSKDGEASFNWRMVFDIEVDAQLPVKDPCTFSLKAWDKDKLKLKTQLLGHREISLGENFLEQGVKDALRQRKRDSEYEQAKTCGANAGELKAICERWEKENEILQKQMESFELKERRRRQQKTRDSEGEKYDEDLQDLLNSDECLDCEEKMKSAITCARYQVEAWRHSCSVDGVSRKCSCCMQHRPGKVVKQIRWCTYIPRRLLTLALRLLFFVCWLILSIVLSFLRWLDSLSEPVEDFSDLHSPVRVTSRRLPKRFIERLSWDAAYKYKNVRRWHLLDADQKHEPETGTAFLQRKSKKGHPGGPKTSVVWVSIELLPKSVADEKVAGPGRQEKTNKHPVLEEPEREKLSFRHPLAALKWMVGPQFYRKAKLLIVTLAILGIFSSMIPLVGANILAKILQSSPFGPGVDCDDGFGPAQNLHSSTCGVHTGARFLSDRSNKHVERVFETCVGPRVLCNGGMCANEEACRAQLSIGSEEEHPANKCLPFCSQIVTAADADAKPESAARKFDNSSLALACTFGGDFYNLTHLPLNCQPLMWSIFKHSWMPGTIVGSILNRGEGCAKGSHSLLPCPHACVRTPRTTVHPSSDDDIECPPRSLGEDGVYGQIVHILYKAVKLILLPCVVLFTLRLIASGPCQDLC